MTMKNSMDEIFDTIEKLREEKYPDIPSDLVEKILRLEVKHSEDPSNSDVLKAIEKLVEQYLGSEEE